MAYINNNELPFSSEELAYFEIQMKKYKVPWIYKFVFGTLYKYDSILIPLLVVILAILGIIGMKHPEYNLWMPIQFISFFLIFGVGGLVLISFLWHRIKVIIQCKRLGLTLKQWNLLAIAFQIKCV